MTDKIVVLSTCASMEDGERVARALVEGRVAACVTILPAARSIYRWRGEIENSPECVLLIKSRRGLFEQLRQELEKVHPYEVPEIVALPIVDGAANYLNWLETEVLQVS